MGWWSGNRSQVNRDTRKRYEEAKDLVGETGEIAEEKRKVKRDFLEQGHRMRMATNLRSVIKSRQAIRKQEERALERVKKVTGNSQLAILKARQGFITDEELKEMYGSFADERIDIFGAKKAGELDIESGYLQDLSQQKQSMANLMASFREEVDPGMGSDIMGMAGSIIGGLL